MTHPHFCSNCGAPLSEQMRFCESCGYPVAPLPEFPCPQEKLPPPIQPSPPLETTKRPQRNKSAVWIPLSLLVSFLEH